jgi:hypothetical protein
MAPDNFFYSKAYSYQFAGPFTHWGAQTNWKLNDRWTTQIGLTNGWDALDRVSDSVGVVGRIRYDNPCNKRWTSFAVVTGNEFNNSAGVAITDEFTNRSRYSFLFGLPLGSRNEYVFHHWGGFQADGAPNGGDAYWYGIDQYLYRNITHRLRAGARFEWFRDEDGTRVGLNRLTNPNVPPFAGNFYSISLGMNWQPMKNVIIRNDIRFDWFDNGTALPFDDGTRDNQTLLGFDAILTF